MTAIVTTETLKDFDEGDHAMRAIVHTESLKEFDGDDREDRNFEGFL